MGIIYTILIFGLIIFIHELGHFLVAKASGVTVHEFALGMGPTILKHQGKNTKYALRLLPIGGFVQMEGEDSQSDDEKAFCKKPIYKKMAIVVAGAVMNLLLGFVIMVVFYAATPIVGDNETPLIGTTTIVNFKEDSASQQAGLKKGDQILKMNKTSILIYDDILFELARDEDGIVDFLVKRDGEKVSVPNVSFAKEGEGENMSINFDLIMKGVKPSFAPVVKNASLYTVSLARNSWVSIGDLFTGKVGLTDLSGPVGVGKVVTQVASNGLLNLLKITAFITISVGMFNLLPFPALDGGRFVFLIIEAIRRKPANAKLEGTINAIGLGLLMVLMLFVTLKDVIGLF
ncbi:MAG: M50 family metallopeptidase [Oscillospiraceae bacterium]